MYLCRCLCIYCICVSCRSLSEDGRAVYVYTARWRSCGAMYCNRPCLCVCGSVTTITLEIACIESSPNWVCIGKGSEHLQLIKFWPSRAPGKGSAAGWKLSVTPYYIQPAHSVCVASERSFHNMLVTASGVAYCHAWHLTKHFCACVSQPSCNGS